MKNIKPVSIFLAAALMVSALCACSSKKAANNGGGNNTPATTAAAGGENNAKAADNSVKFSTQDGKTIFTVDPSFKLHTYSWMGIVPAGKAYKTEGEADEVDIIWMNPDAFEEGQTAPAKFVFDNNDIEGVGNGDYIMVLCENDDDEASKVYLYFPITINGSTLTADLSKLVIN